MMHGAPLGTDALAGIAARLGADVAFFAGSTGLARGEGIGERLSALAPLEPRELVVAVPPVGVPTGPAYGWVAASRASGGTSEPLPDLGALDWSRIEGLAGNDFHAVVADHVPEVGALAEVMVGIGLTGVLLSGSGSALFGFPTPGLSAADAAKRLTESTVGTRAWAVGTLGVLPPPQSRASRG
jgi:4-diphosphocytidyl-2-C-methyl-D-erythritol kinase